MALAAYETLTAALLQAPSSPIPLVPTATLDSYINTARAQLAADAECIRIPGTLALSAAVQSYGFAAISATGAGVGSVMAVRSARIANSPIYIRSWEWFAQYYLISSTVGRPTRAAQQGQGVKGTLFFHPIPDAGYTLSLDAVCLPIPLANDTTAEAIPSLWTDAIPFYAAWLAFMSLQRQSDADMMYRRYQELARRGRQLSTATELPNNQPGGLGTQVAATKTTLSVPAPQPQNSRG